jgi:hypothetical protein
MRAGQAPALRLCRPARSSAWVQWRQQARYFRRESFVAYQPGPNDLLRVARLALRSPSGSGRPMSRQELADAVNAAAPSRSRMPDTGDRHPSQRPLADPTAARRTCGELDAIVLSAVREEAGTPSRRLWFRVPALVRDRFGTDARSSPVGFVGSAVGPMGLRLLCLPASRETAARSSFQDPCTLMSSRHGAAWLDRPGRARTDRSTSGQLGFAGQVCELGRSG